MKKYILLISLCCFAFLQSGAITKMMESAPQDTIRIYKGKKNLDGSGIIITPNLEGYTIDPNTFDFDFDIDTSQLLALKENFKNMESFDFSELKEQLRGLESFNFDELKENFSNYDFGNLNGFSVEQKDKTPKSVENKTFSNISEVEFFHRYGNIVVKESTSKNVELEIRYFGQSVQNPVNISSQNGLLSVNSKSSSINQVDFVISIPRSTKLNVDLKYGHLKMDDFKAAFSANLAYSSIDAGSFSGVKPVIKDKYGKVTIGTIQDIDLSASYSKVNIGKADRLDLSGAYSDYVIGDVKTIIVQGSSVSGDFKIGSLGSIDGKFNYADMDIGNLRSGINMTCNYSDIKVNSMSQNAKIYVKGNYSDVILSIPDNLGASFNTSLYSGDLIVSKKYTVKYSEQSERSNRVVKKGQIGSKTPTITIDISGNYGDVKIQ